MEYKEQAASSINRSPSSLSVSSEDVNDLSRVASIANAFNLSKSLRLRQADHGAYSVTLPGSWHSGEETRSQTRVRTVIESGPYQVWICCVVLAGWVLCCADVDARSSQRTAYWDEHNSTVGFRYNPGMIVEILNYTAVAIFAIDCFCRFFISDPRSYFCNPLNFLDAMSVVADVCLICLDDAGDKPAVSFLRIFRALKLIRAIRTSSTFRDLYLMLDGLLAAMRPITFAVIMLMMFLSFIAVVAVEFVHMDNMANQQEGMYGDCPDSVCKEAYGSVWYAMMTFFKTIIAGDSWGQMNYPLVTEQPHHAWIVLGSILMIQVGLLNLIVAVMVDRIHEVRLRDDEFMLAEKRDEYEFTKEKLKKIYDNIDTDRSGTVSVQEMRTAYVTMPEFKFILDTLDVREWEMDIVFEICDYNSDNQINFDEFAEALYNLKSRNPVTLLMYIRQHTSKLVGLMSLTARRMERQETAIVEINNAVLQRNERQADGSRGSGRRGKTLDATSDVLDVASIIKQEASTRSALQDVDAQPAASELPNNRRSLDELDCAFAALQMTAEAHCHLGQRAFTCGSDSTTSNPRSGAVGEPPIIGEEASKPLIIPVELMSQGSSGYDSAFHAFRPARASDDGSSTAQAVGETDPGHRPPRRKRTHPHARVPPSSKSLGADIRAKPAAHEEPRGAPRPDLGDAHGQAALLAHCGAAGPAFQCNGSSSEPSRWRDRMPGA